MAVTLKVKYSRSEIVSGLQSYDLKAEVTEASGVSDKIFVMQRGVDPYPSEIGVSDVFVCLADPVDLEEIPADSPNLGEEMPYFRVDTITLRFRSMDILEEVKTLLNADIVALVNALNIADTLDVTEEIDYA